MPVVHNVIVYFFLKKRSKISSQVGHYFSLTSHFSILSPLKKDMQLVEVSNARKFGFNSSSGMKKQIQLQIVIANLMAGKSAGGNNDQWTVIYCLLSIYTC